MVRCAALFATTDGDLQLRLRTPIARPMRVALTVLALTAGVCSQAWSADLVVTVTGVHAGAGAIRVALYRDASSFRHEKHAVAVMSTPADAATAKVVFHDIPAGQYAVLAYHDANSNGKLDLRLGMFPREGWGLSNDPHVVGPPRFGPSAFAVTDSGTSISLPLHY